MKDLRKDFLPYITTADGRLTDLVYQLIEFTGKINGDHAHCELCWVKICDIESPEYERSGYYCSETGCWLCKKCFSDFSQTYNWHSKKQEEKTITQEDSIANTN